MPARKKTLFDTVAILGLGLMGGSLALAIKRNHLARHVIGANRTTTPIRIALSRHAIDEGAHNFIQAASRADLVILATTISAIPHLLQIIAPALKRDAIVTDVGSTKARIVEEASYLMRRRGEFIGGHPMAGSHKQGMASASAELLYGAKYFLTPTRRSNSQALAILQRFVRGLHMQPIVIDPKVHDEVMAMVSHVPIAVAATLMNSLRALGSKEKLAKVMAGMGLRDTARIAAGSPEMGADIFLTNRHNMLNAIRAFRRELVHLEDGIARAQRTSILRFLQHAKDRREALERER